MFRVLITGRLYLERITVTTGGRLVHKPFKFKAVAMTFLPLKLDASKKRYALGGKKEPYPVRSTARSR